MMLITELKELMNGKKVAKDSMQETAKRLGQELMEFVKEQYPEVRCECDGVYFPEAHPANMRGWIMPSMKLTVLFDTDVDKDKLVKIYHNLMESLGFSVDDAMGWVRNKEVYIPGTNRRVFADLDYPMFKDDVIAFDVMIQVVEE